MTDCGNSPSPPKPAPDIHVVVRGSQSVFIAHCLRALKSPPAVSFMSSRGHVFTDWVRAGGATVLKTDDLEQRQTGCDLQRFEWPDGISRADFYRSSPDGESGAAGSQSADEEAIHNLVITGSGHLAAKTVHLLRHRLHPQSTVLLLATGMGVYEEIITRVYPDAESRPNFILGFSTHEVRRLLSATSSNTFSVYRTNDLGTMPMFCVPRNATLREDFADSEIAPTAHYLVDTLTQCPELAVSALPFADAHPMMLEALAVDSAIQSVATLLDTSYNGMLYNFTITQALRLLLTETCLVVRALPELRGQPDLDSRFDPDRLYDVAVQRLYRQFNTTAQMALDVRNGKPTEVRYLNGYIVRRGDEVGLRCFMNYLVMQLIRGKSSMVRRELVREIPSDIWQSEPE